MNCSSTTGPGASPNLVVGIIETLETCGLDRDEYQLYNAVDVEALEEILHSSCGDVEVRFTVEDIRLAVTPDSVNILIDEHPDSAD